MGMMGSPIISLDVGLAEQLSIIEKLRQSFSVTTLCHVFSVHRSSYKYWRCRPKRVSPELVKLKSLIKEVHTASNGSAGASSIADMVTPGCKTGTLSSF